MQCTHLTKSGSVCKRKSIHDTKFCTIHQGSECPVCFEVMTSHNKKTLTCKHTFHTNCILKWFVENNTCPVCRVPQPNDEFVVFGNMVADNIRAKYRDAILSLENEIREIRFPRRLVVYETDSD